MPNISNLRRNIIMRGLAPLQSQSSAQLVSPEPQFGDADIADPYTPPMNMTEDDGRSELMNRIVELFSPDRTQMSRLASSIEMQPRREDYKPSKMRIVGSALAGLGAGGPAGIVGGQPVGYQSNIPAGLKIQQHLMDQPFDRAMTDWQNQTAPLGELAKLENQSNTQDRMIGGQLLTDERGRMVNERIAAKNKSDAEIADRKVRVQEARVEIEREKAKNPNLKSVIDKDGMLVLYDTKSGDIFETGIDTGKLDEREKIQLQIAGRLEAIAAQSAAARELESDRQGNRLEVIGERGREARATKEVVPGKNATGASQSGNSQLQAQYAKAQEIYNKNPEWQKFIQLDKDTKKFRVTAPKAGFAGLFGGDRDVVAEKEIIDQILAEIYGSSDKAPSTIDNPRMPGDLPSMAPLSTTPVTKPTTRPDGKTKVKRKSDGVVGWVTNPDLTLYELVP